MLTLFTIPKPFTGAAARAQDNTIASWVRLDPSCQIVLFGDDEGIAEAARRHGVEHEPRIRRSRLGTPLLDDAFTQAQDRAVHRLVCYANADIVFTSSLMRALSLVSFDKFLLVGRRTNLDVPDPIDFAQEDWAIQLEQRARKHGDLYPPTGIDYFVFPRGQIRDMLPFPVGRVLWDNWMIHHSRTLGIPVIDATPTILAVHQNHDYGHICGGQNTAWTGEEVEDNWRMVGPDFLQLSIDDATHMLEDGRVRPALDFRHIIRRILVWPALSPTLRPSVRVARYLRKRVMG
jgi:hypothetical protein